MLFFAILPLDGTWFLRLIICSSFRQLTLEPAWFCSKCWIVVCLMTLTAAFQLEKRYVLLLCVFFLFIYLFILVTSKLSLNIISCCMMFQKFPCTWSFLLSSFLSKCSWTSLIWSFFLFIFSYNRQMSIMLLNLMVKNWQSRFTKLQSLYSSMTNNLRGFSISVLCAMLSNCCWMKASVWTLRCMRKKVYRICDHIWLQIDIPFLISWSLFLPSSEVLIHLYQLETMSGWIFHSG